MKKILYIFFLISICSCYTLQKDERGTYIYYKGAKTEILKDEKNYLYFINKKGKKVKLTLAEPFEMGNPFKK
jgi:hypothetical protein